MENNFSVHDSKCYNFLADIITTSDYWDCECEQDYIYPKSEQTCSRCQAIQYEQPDSRVNEVQNKMPSAKFRFGIYVSMVFIPIEVEAENIEEAHIQAEEIARTKLDSLADGDYLEYKFEIDEVGTSLADTAFRKEGD
jgi:hypothetical protein